jgi:hypothetical protein
VQREGWPATGKQFHVDGVTVNRSCKGQMVESKLCWKLADLLQQVGFMPAPSRGGRVVVATARATEQPPRVATGYVHPALPLREVWLPPCRWTAPSSRPKPDVHTNSQITACALGPRRWPVGGGRGLHPREGRRGEYRCPVGGAGWRRVVSAVRSDTRRSDRVTQQARGAGLVIVAAVPALGFTDQGEGLLRGGVEWTPTAG